MKVKLIMDKNKLIGQISEQIKGLFDNNYTKDIEHNIKAILASVFSKLDLVSREEFDVQQKVLTATRQKLEELEAQVQKLLEK